MYFFFPFDLKQTGHVTTYIVSSDLQMQKKKKVQKRRFSFVEMRLKKNRNHLKAFLVILRCFYNVHYQLSIETCHK